MKSVMGIIYHFKVKKSTRKSVFPGGYGAIQELTRDCVSDWSHESARKWSNKLLWRCCPPHVL